ncbi:helix-turn-helix transcriptional regulator [Candidatus Sumerlaeota bacterium]|nr:helix-turn-helix transcriptional regulator [Candidatus Sumerlaeota bacterium]
MPIIIHLDRMLLERKITLTELAERVGITIANLSVLKTNKAKAIRFSTLEALCKELHCQPKDILEYVEGEDALAAEEAEGAVAPETEAEAGEVGKPPKPLLDTY